MAEFPAIPLFTDAYLADTRHLTAAQHGAYLLLLFTAWRSPECRLPDDDVFLSRCASMDLRTWRSNKTVVMQFWRQDEQQNWFQRRLVDERNLVADKRNKNVAAGNSSALKRKERHSTGVATDGQPKHNHPKPTTLNLNPEEERKEEDGGASQSSACPTSSKIHVEKAIRRSADAAPVPAWNGDNDAEIPKNAVVELSGNPRWGLPDDLFDHSKNLGWSEDSIFREIEGFFGYWHLGRGSGKRKSVKGWRQAWFNWLKIAAERAKNG